MYVKFYRSGSRDVVQHHKCLLCATRLTVTRRQMGLHLRRCHGGMAVAEYEALYSEDLEPLFKHWNDSNPLRQ